MDDEALLEECKNPDWRDYKTVDWKNYISSHIQDHWDNFSPFQKYIIASNAEEISQRVESGEFT